MPRKMTSLPVFLASKGSHVNNMACISGNLVGILGKFCFPEGGMTPFPHPFLLLIFLLFFSQMWEKLTSSHPAAVRWPAKPRRDMVGWLSGKGTCFLSSLTTWLRSPEPTRQKGRTGSLRLSSNLQMGSMTLVYPPTQYKKGNMKKN